MKKQSRRIRFYNVNVPAELLTRVEEKRALTGFSKEGLVIQLLSTYVGKLVVKPVKKAA